MLFKNNAANVTCFPGCMHGLLAFKRALIAELIADLCFGSETYP